MSSTQGFHYNRARVSWFDPASKTSITFDTARLFFPTNGIQATLWLIHLVIFPLEGDVCLMIVDTVHDI